MSLRSRGKNTHNAVRKIFFINAYTCDPNLLLFCICVQCKKVWKTIIHCLLVTHSALVIFCLWKKLSILHHSSSSFLSFFLSFFFFASQTTLLSSGSTQHAGTQWDVFPKKLFTVSSLHPALYIHSSTAEKRKKKREKKKKRRQPCWQLLLFKASLMARQFLLPLGRWLGEDEESDCDCRLCRTSQLQLALTVPQSTHPLSSSHILAFVNSRIEGMAVTRLSVCVSAPGWWPFHPHQNALSRRQCLQPLLLVRCLPGVFYY